jgi:N-acetylmuramoyl-L-alanine amidase
VRATWLGDVLRDAGLTVRSYTGWETRGRNDFTPRGIILHHTVTKPTTPDLIIDKFLATTGSSTTPAPLCNYSTNRDGSISLIAAGTANHGGTGRWLGVTGNKNFFGDEMKNLGTPAEPWNPKQLESARIAAAAIMAHLGFDNAAFVCGHKEYATPAGRKSDPHTLDMNAIRLIVTAKMNGVDMAWEKPGDAVNTLADVKAVHAWQGNEVMKPADIDYVEVNPALIDNRWKVIVARLLGVIMK